MKRNKNKLFLAGILSVLMFFISSGLQYAIQTHFGQVKINTTQIVTSDGRFIEAKIYIPAGASAENRCPLLITSAGGNSEYAMIEPINEELAGNGYAILTFSMFNHGNSSFSDDPDYGVLDAIRYGFTLPFADTENVGLLGQARSSVYMMRTVINNDLPVKAIFSVDFTADMDVLQGYTSDTPVNLAWVINDKNEFLTNPLAAYTDSELLRVFNTEGKIESGRIYGSLSDNAERILYSSSSTDSFYAVSGDVISSAIDFFHRTLGGTEHARSNIGWLLLFQFVSMASLFAMILSVSLSVSYTDDADLVILRKHENIKSLVLCAISSALYIPLYIIGKKILPATWLFPQNDTNGQMIWEIVVTVIIIVCIYLFGNQKNALELLARSRRELGRDLFSAFSGVAIGYFALLIKYELFGQTAAFLNTNMSVFSANRLMAALAYFPVFLIFSVCTEMIRILYVRRDRGSGQWIFSALFYTAPMLILALVNLSGFFLYGRALFHWGRFAIPPINYMLPVLPFIGIICDCSYQRSGKIFLGAIISAAVLIWLFCSSNAFFYF